MTPTPIGTLYYVEPTAYKAQKALVAARFNGVAIIEAKFDVEKDYRKPGFVEKNPTGRVPFLQTEGGCIFNSNAIARYVARCRADTFIYGKSFDDEAQIDSWLELCTHELEVPLMTWLYPVMGLLEDQPDATKQLAYSDVKQVLSSMEAQLKKTSFLLGDYLTLADIVLVCSLRQAFALLFDPAFRKPFPVVCAWFERCCDMPQFRAVLGDMQLCTQAEKPKPVKNPVAPKKAEAKAKADAKGKAQAKLAASPANATAVSAEAEEQIKNLGDEIRSLKLSLKKDGLDGQQINDHPDVKQLVTQLKELKSGKPAAAPATLAAKAVATAPAEASTAASTGVDEAAIKAVGDEIRALKAKLKGEGLDGKQINNHPEIKTLVEKITGLKMGMTGAAAAPAASASAAAAPAGDLDAQIKAVGDEIRTLKEKLKGEGIKKVNDHEDVEKLVTQLKELKQKQVA